MPSCSRRHLLQLLGASLTVASLPGSARATQEPAPWTGGRVWIVGAGSLAMHLVAAFEPVLNLQARTAERLADCSVARGDVVLMHVSPPATPVAPALFAEILGKEVQGLREAGVTPVLVGLEVATGGAEAWSMTLDSIASTLGVPLIDRAGFAQSVDAARAQAGPVAMAEAVVRRLGLYLPLRHRGARAQLRPLGLQSPACGKPMPALAVVPDDVPEGGLPVLYLLHGAWGAYSDWALAAHEALLELSAQHGLILVLPHGEPFGWYLDSPLVAESQIRTHVIDELVPYVDAQLPTNGVRSIGGLSMGGHGAFLLALQHPGVFRSASSMSGAIDITHVPKSKQITRLLGKHDANKELWAAHSAARQLVAKADVARALPLKLACGTEDIWFQTNLELHERLDKMGIAHDWQATPGAGHTWPYWIAQLPQHVAWHATHLVAPKEAP